MVAAPRTGAANRCSGTSCTAPLLQGEGGQQAAGVGDMRRKQAACSRRLLCMCRLQRQVCPPDTVHVLQLARVQQHKVVLRHRLQRMAATQGDGVS